MAIINIRVGKQNDFRFLELVVNHHFVVCSIVQVFNV